MATSISTIVLLISNRSIYCNQRLSNTRLSCLFASTFAITTVSSTIVHSSKSAWRWSRRCYKKVFKQHLCAKQKNNKSAQFAEFTVTNASIVKAEKVIQIRKCVTLKWNEIISYYIWIAIFAENLFAQHSAPLQASLDVGHDRTTGSFIRSLVSQTSQVQGGLQKEKTVRWILKNVGRFSCT